MLRKNPIRSFLVVFDNVFLDKLSTMANKRNPENELLIESVDVISICTVVMVREEEFRSFSKTPKN